MRKCLWKLLGIKTRKGTQITNLPGKVTQISNVFDWGKYSLLGIIFVTAYTHVEANSIPRKGWGYIYNDSQVTYGILSFSVKKRFLLHSLHTTAILPYCWCYRQREKKKWELNFYIFFIILFLKHDKVKHSRVWKDQKKRVKDFTLRSHSMFHWWVLLCTPQHAFWPRWF